MGFKAATPVREQSTMKASSDTVMGMASLSHFNQCSKLLTIKATEIPQSATLFFLTFVYKYAFRRTSSAKQVFYVVLRQSSEECRRNY